MELTQSSVVEQSLLSYDTLVNGWCRSDKLLCTPLQLAKNVCLFTAIHKMAILIKYRENAFEVIGNIIIRLIVRIKKLKKKKNVLKKKTVLATSPSKKHREKLWPNYQPATVCGQLNYCIQQQICKKDPKPKRGTHPLGSWDHICQCHGNRQLPLVSHHGDQLHQPLKAVGQHRFCQCVELGALLQDLCQHLHEGGSGLQVFVVTQAWGRGRGK